MSVLGSRRSPPDRDAELRLEAPRALIDIRDVVVLDLLHELDETHLGRVLTEGITPVLKGHPQEKQE